MFDSKNVCHKEIKIFLIVLLMFAAQLYATSFPTLSNKQGIADRNNNILLESRYKVFEDKLAIGIQKYNYYWKNCENTIASSSQPNLQCPQGSLLFPKSKKEKELLKIHNYHCYSNKFIKQWTKRFQQNQKHHIQLAVVLWTSPKFYRDKGCEGFYFPLQKRHLMDGCYPTAEHYNDYEDWIRFTAFTFGKYIDHYIVWNEVDSTNWADSSTSKYPKKVMLKDKEFHMKRSFDIYKALLTRTITSVQDLDNVCSNGSECQNLIYISLNRDWYGHKILVRQSKEGDIHILWRNMNLLDYLWKTVGLQYDWSIAIHPYGDVYNQYPNILTFSTLKDLSSYQKIHINLNKKEANKAWLDYAQSKLFASEQNAGDKLKADDWKRKAKFICQAYDIGLKMPELIAMTHNHFQDNIQAKNKVPTKYTMLPASVKANLSDADRYETFQAYESTNPLVWGKTDTHFCCQSYKLGCLKN